MRGTETAPVRRAWPGAAALALAALAASCGDRTDAPASPAAGSDPAPAWFVEITAEVGLPEPGAWPDGTFSLPEIMGTGAALFDADGDGDLDLLHVRMPPPGRPDDPAPNRLWTYDGGRFVDATERSGLGHPGWGHGVSVGDVDDDGDSDVFFANLGPDALFLNNGDGTFTDATGTSGIRGDLWSAASAFCDYDTDGDLDLFVTHYVRFDVKAVCKDSSGMEDYCDPRNFDGVPDKLYRNEGGGRFTDVTESAGLILPDGGKKAKGLGVVCFDATGDGLSDVYVANDGEANQLWVNQGGGRFAEQGIMRGVAVNRDGLPEASMGIAVGDVDGDLRYDMLVTHLRGENNTLYTPTDGLLFRDRTAESAMTRDDLEWTGFGCGFLDLDLDGDLDLLVANGRVYRDRVIDGAEVGPFWNQYAEPNLAFENDGSGRFRNVGSRVGSFARRVEVSRGLTLGDLDEDGDLDVVLVNLNDAVRVYRNDSPGDGRHWLAVRARTGGRDAVGADVIVTAGGKRYLRGVVPSASFMSCSESAVHFGLGEAEVVDSIEVRWPSGATERFDATGVDRTVVLVEGTGVVP